jgi:hypothetical protein
MPDADDKPSREEQLKRKIKVKPHAENLAHLKAWHKHVQASQKTSAEQSQRSRGLFVIQIALLVNDLDQLLDEFEVEDNKEDRRRLLERSLLLSIRGLDLLQQEPLVASPDTYLASMRKRVSDEEWAASEALRHDETTLRLFLTAECRLLASLGVSETAVSRIRNSLEGAIREVGDTIWEAAKNDRIAEQMQSGFQKDIQAVVDQLTAELNQLYKDDRHKKLIGRLAGVFSILGGVLVIATNAAVGTAGAPATMGVTAVGAALSTAAGGEVISRGVDLAKAKD